MSFTDNLERKIKLNFKKLRNKKIAFWRRELLSEYRISFWAVENVWELDGGSGYTALCNNVGNVYFKLKLSIFCYVKFT